MIKLIAIDLDGTLINDEKKLSPENLKALHYAHDKGIKIVLCTGRPYLATDYLITEIGLKSDDDYMIIFNGAQVRRTSDAKVIVENTLTHEDMKKWYQETQALNLPLNVVDQEWVYEPEAYPIGYESTYTSLTQAPSRVQAFDLFKNEHQFFKFVINVNEEHLRKQIPKINSALLENYSVSLSHPFQLEVMKKGVNKGNTLRQLGEKIGIELEEMMTFGDQLNDESMIEMAGLGIAVDNAVPEIKALADFVTASNNDDGVAKAIYHFIK